MNCINSFFSNKYSSEIILIVIIRLIGILLSFILFPITLDFVGAKEYGIWLSISSIISWLSFFDLGFGNGLRNKFAEARTRGKHLLAKSYISTVYFFITAVSIFLFGVFVFFEKYIPWEVILNYNSVYLRQVIFIIFLFFLFQFILKNVFVILYADQKSSIVTFIELLTQLFTIVVLITYSKFYSGNLLSLSLIISGSSFFILLVSNVYLFYFKYSNYLPNFRFVRLRISNGLLKLGRNFLLIQIASIIQYQTINFLIIHYFSAKDVTQYNIALKYFSVISLAFSIIILPFWSAVTEAKTGNNYNWIKKSVNYYLLVWAVLSLVIIVMIFISRNIYIFWLGSYGKEVDFQTTLWVGIISISTMFSGIFVSVINGIGALKIQLIFAFITPILFVTLAILLIESNKFGLEAILISSFVSNISGCVIIPIQYYKIINGHNGIWIR